MRISEKTYLDYCDVLIVPQRSSLDSRKDVSLTRDFTFKYSHHKVSCTPIISANMTTTGSLDVANEMHRLGCLGTLDKNYSSNYIGGKCIFYTMGMSDKDIDLLEKYLENHNDFPLLICIDIANGYSNHFRDYVSKIRERVTFSIIMAGNVATPNMTEELILAGADIVKIGVGNGAQCLTRMKTGVGIPQLSAVDECSYVAHGLGGHICADGGITCAGDVCKALCAGADFVMIGSLLARAKECGGERVFVSQDGPYVKHHGSSSDEYKKYHNMTKSDYATSEGKEELIPCDSSVEEIIRDIRGGIASCCTYIGAARIKDMPKCASFVKVNRVH